MSFSIKNMLFGFIAAAIAVVTVHQGIIYLLGVYKLLPATVQAWSVRPIGPFGVPTIANSIFWGGLWGLLFSIVWPKLPGGAMWLRGLIFGWIIVLVSNWTLLPFVKSTVFNQPNQVYFSGSDPQRMLITLAILGGFGLMLGLVYGLLHDRD